jgi:hypothetical protein
MPKQFHRVKPLVSLNDFLTKAKTVESFTSSTGRRYSVDSVIDDAMYFYRLDADENTIWKMDLKNLYRAYQELEDFATINFKPYVPITHSPARGLLLHLEMLE